MPRPTCLALLGLLGLFALALTGAATAEDWPRFRGTQGAGVSSSGQLPTEFGPEQHVIWKTPLPGGGSSPIISGRQLFVTYAQGDDRALVCLDAETGQQQWVQTIQKVRSESENPMNGPATCTPVTDGQHVVAFFPDAGLCCYSVSGQQLWCHDVGPFHSMHGIAHSPVLAGDKVILLADQLRGSFIAAYQVNDGSQVWKRERPDGLTGAYSTPLIHARDGKTEIVTSGPGGLYVYDLADGQLRFSVPGVANAPVTIPVLHGGRLFLCEPVGEAMPISTMLPTYDKNQDGKLSFEEAGPDGPILRLLERIERGWGNGDKAVDAEEWNKAFDNFIDSGGLVAIDVKGTADAPAAEVAWSVSKQVPYVASPVIYGDLLYMVKDGGILTVVDPDSGTQVLTKRLRKGGKPVYASPVAGDGKIFIIDTSGQLTVLEAGREAKELFTTSLNERCVATPALCNSCIYVRTGGHVYCFGDTRPRPE